MTKRILATLALAACADREQPHSIQREMPEIVDIAGGAFEGRRLPCEDQRDSGDFDVELHVNEFAIDRSLVSCAAFARCVDARVCRPLTTDVTHGDWPDPGCDEGLAFVRASEAETYCKFVGGRVPTSIEWQRAIRGTAAWTHPGGAEASASCFKRTSRDLLHPRCMYTSRDDVTYALRSFGIEHLRDRDCAAVPDPAISGVPHAYASSRGSDLTTFALHWQRDTSALGYFRCVYPPHDK